MAAPVQAPTGLMYPQTTISTYVGQPITPDMPAAAGTLTSYTVSPALPPGVSIDPSTGVISGTPTAPASQATYVITGSNAAGSVTASVSPTITVTAAPIVLLQLGNQYQISDLQFANSNVLSQGVGFWILRKYASGAILASGDADMGFLALAGGIRPPAAQMAGPTLAIGVTGGIEVLSSADGHLLGTIVSPAFGIEPNTKVLQEIDFWQLASDGSYISVETSTGLYVYAPSGQLLLSQAGDYLTGLARANYFAAPGQVQVANGPAGANAIQTIAVPSGVPTVSPAYQAQFYAWFADGGRFLTENADFVYGNPVNPTAGSTVWTYSSSGVQQAAVQFPFWASIGGAGNWIWLYGADGNQPAVNVYPIGSTTPALTDSNGDIAEVAASGTTLAVLPQYSMVSVIDLSGATPVKTDYTLPTPVNYSYSSQYPAGPYAAASSTQWVVGVGVIGNATPSSLLLDGPSLPTSTRRYLGNGAALSIAGSTGVVAIATGGGQVSYFNPADTTPEGSISLTSGEVELSSDGSVLAAASDDGALLNLYSLPSGAVSHTFSYSSNAPGLLSSFTLSASGNTLGTMRNIGNADRSTTTTLQVTPVSGSPTILSGTSENFYSPVAISPDGTLVAVTNGVPPSITSTIYQNGTQVAVVPGIGVGWIDNGRLLVDAVGSQGYIGTTIYSPTGAVLGTPPLPQLQSIQPVTSDTVYVPSRNAIYSVTTGQTTWTSPYLPDSGVQQGIGAVAGPYVVFESEGRVIAVTH